MILLLKLLDYNQQKGFGRYCNRCVFFLILTTDFMIAISIVKSSILDREVIQGGVILKFYCCGFEVDILSEGMTSVEPQCLFLFVCSSSVIQHHLCNISQKTSLYSKKHGF